MSEHLERVRENTAQALIRAGCEPEGIKLLSCGSPVYLRCQCCARPHEIPGSCRRRWCPVCERVRSAKMVSLYTPLITAMTWPLFITLTVRHSATDSVADVFQRVHEGWTRFKKLGWFKRTVRGGVGAIEISSASDDDDYDRLGTWNGAHPHVHALLDCSWLSVHCPPPRRGASKTEVRSAAIKSQREVVEQWRLASRSDEAGMFVRRAKPGTIEEVLKYSLKPGDLLDERVNIAELVNALSRRKLVVPWGRIRKALPIVRAELLMKQRPMMCECGGESWEFDPGQPEVTYLTSGKCLTPRRGPNGEFRGYAKFVPWDGERD